MDDMMSGSSAYLKEDYVKRKFLATWEELCDVLRIPSTIEVSHEEENGSYSGTGYPEINRRVQRLLKNDQFPDHMDICEMVERCNTKHKLGISSSEKVELSRKVFKEVGKIIKSRRIKDYKAHFGCHLTDAVVIEDDPAIRDQVLLEELKKSMNQGQKLMQDLVDGFVVKQEVEAEKRGDSMQGDSCNSDEEEEEGEGEGEGEGEAVIEIGEDDECEMDSNEGGVDSNEGGVDSNEGGVDSNEGGVEGGVDSNEGGVDSNEGGVDSDDEMGKKKDSEEEVGRGNPPSKRLKLDNENGVSSPNSSLSSSPSEQGESPPSGASGDSIDVVGVDNDLLLPDHHNDSHVTIISDSEDNEVTTSILDHDDDSDVVIISDSD